MHGLVWIAKHPKATPEMLGYIPGWIHEDDSRPIKEQIDNNYRHGGGWYNFQGFTMAENGNLHYPGDPPTLLLFEAKLRDETIRFYQHSWVAIVQKDGSFEVARID
jgi:hypothetical protein